MNENTNTSQIPTTAVKEVSKKTVKNHMITGIVGIFVALVSFGGFNKAYSIKIPHRHHLEQPSNHAQYLLKKRSNIYWVSSIILLISLLLLIFGWVFYSAYKNEERYVIVDKETE